jgi:hypothetical protein
MQRLVSRRGCRRVFVATVAWVVAMNGGIPPASASPVPGLLSPGTYTMRLVRSGLSADGPGRGVGAIYVSQSGTDTVERFDLQPDIIELVLATTGLGTNPKVMLKELVVGGIYFPASPAVLWRPLDHTGRVQQTSWQWTLNSSNGGVTLQTFSSARAPTAFSVANGQAVLVQEVTTTMYFGGTASGSIEVNHWEVVGESNEMFESYSGTFTFFGSTTRVDTLLLLGTLAGELAF